MGGFRCGLHESVTVELVEGKVVRHSSDWHVVNQAMSFDETFRAHPLPGSSIGSSSTGTLGGYLKLEHRPIDGTPEVKILAITAHHVVCPGKCIDDALIYMCTY